MTNTTYTTNDINTYNALVAADIAAAQAGKPSDAEFDMILIEKRIQRDFGTDALADFLAVASKAIRSPFAPDSDII